MMSMTRARIAASAGSAAVLAGSLTLGLAGSASAASPWQLKVCSYGSYQTNVYWSGGYMPVPAGQCRTANWQRTSASSYVVHVDAYVNNGGYIGGANVDIAQGAGLATGGTPSAPALWSI